METISLWKRENVPIGKVLESTSVMAIADYDELEVGVFTIFKLTNVYFFVYIFLFIEE